MLWVKIGTQIADHPRFLEAGALARDLWAWGMVYSGSHELDGEIPMAAVLSSPWGYGTKANVKLADTLVRLGLWERTNTGYRICRWAEQGNETKASIATKREVGRERKARFDERSRNAVTNAGSNAFSSTSTSLSSGYGSGSQIASAPEWWPDTLGTIEMTTGVALPAGEAWLRYSGHRSGKHLPATPADAAYWLGTVMVREARADRDAVAHRADRDKAFDAKRRFAKDGPEKPPPPTKAQSEAFANELAARLTTSRKVGT